MALFALTIGLTVRHGDQTWRLARNLEDGTLIFEDLLTGRVYTFTVPQFYKELQDRKLQLVGGTRPSGKYIDDKQALLAFSLDSLSARDRRDAEAALAYIKEARKRGLTRGQRKGLKKMIDELPSFTIDRRPPSVDTLMRWMRKFEDSRGSPIAVVPRRAFKLARAPRLNPEIIAIARRLINTKYCTRDRQNLTSAKIEIDREIELRKVAGLIAPEAAQPSYTTLRRLVAEIDPYSLDRARLGRDAAENKWRYSLKGIVTTRALERYEIDHTIVDLVCVCDRTGLPLGRPTLTIVVDSFSGYVVGINISFWSTGLATTFRAFRVAISPKDQFNAVLQGTCPWLGYGVPELIVVDNGLEFHSPMFTSMAVQLMMDIEYCKVRTPWLKPFVERTLGAYLKYLPSAGRVRKPIDNEVPVSPAKSAAVTFSSLCFGILKIFTEVHAQEVNHRKLCRPVDRYEESFSRMPPPRLESNLEALDLIVAPSQQMAVGKEGVVYNYLRFNSEELKSLWRKTAHRFKTDVKFDVESLGHIWVKNPENNSYLRVPCTNPEYSEGLTLIQHRAIRRSLKDELELRNAPEKLLRAKRELIDHWSASISRGKKISAEHVRALSGLTMSKALLNPEKSSASTLESHLVSSQQLTAQEREIPTFSGFEMY